MSRDAQYRQACQRLSAEEYALTTVLRKEQNKDDRIINLIKSCAYGILVRQSVEYIVNGKLQKVCRGNSEALLALKDKELIEKIDILREFQSRQQPLNDLEFETYHRTRGFSNKIAHACYFDEYEKEFNKFRDKYSRRDGQGTRDGCELLKQYIDKYLRENPYENNRYLRQLRQNIEDFNFINVYDFLYDEKNKLAYVLLTGLLIRHCVEHFVEISLLKNSFLYPTAEDGKIASLFTKIDALDKEFEIGVLHRVRKATNAIIHINDMAERNNGNYVRETEATLVSVYDQLLEVRQAGLQKKQRVYRNTVRSENIFKPVRLSKWQRIKPFMVPLIIISAVICFLFVTIFVLAFGSLGGFIDRIIEVINDYMFIQIF